MKEKVSNFMDKHQLIRENTTVLVAVSGGPDSTALLHFYESMKDDWNVKVKAISVDHQLRGAESKADLQYVSDICKQWDIPLVKASLNVRQKQAEQRLSTQVASREARYHYFKEQMYALDADYLALGHHADDQVETMLMGFVRSASITALAGMPIKREFGQGQIVRPFLCLTKAEIFEYCKQQSIQPRFDPSNEDLDDLRIYFRKSIIPLLKEKNNNIHTTVQRLSEGLQTDNHLLQKQAEEMVSDVVSFPPKKQEAAFLIKDFTEHPHSLQRRAYHLILDYLYHTLPGNLSYTHEDIFFSLLKHNKGNIKVDFPNELQIKKIYHKIVFSFTCRRVEKPFGQLPISIPGQTSLPNDKTLVASQVDELDKDHNQQFTFQVDEVALPLMVRTRRPGDRMSWKGLGGTKKIKDIFIDEKIPHEERDHWPIVSDHEGKIIWLVGIRKAEIDAEPKKGPFIKLVYQEDSIQEGQHV